MGGCFCCCQSDSAGETQPLLAPPVSRQVPSESARQHHPPPNASELKSGQITARRVGVPDLDQRFLDVAETFNEQQKHYECMTERLKTLTYRYRCSPEDSFSKCLKKIMEEHDTHHVRLHMKGYDFILVVMPDDDVPDKLKQTQENVKELCQAAKAIISVGPKLQQMINWVLKEENSLTHQVTKAASDHQERQRQTGNLQENLREAQRAKELFPQYKKDAEKLLKEAALLSGMTP